MRQLALANRRRSRRAQRWADLIAHREQDPLAAKRMCPPCAVGHRSPLCVFRAMARSRAITVRRV